MNDIFAPKTKFSLLESMPAQPANDRTVASGVWLESLSIKECIESIKITSRHISSAYRSIRTEIPLLEPIEIPFAFWVLTFDKKTIIDTPCDCVFVSEDNTSYPIKSLQEKIWNITLAKRQGGSNWATLCNTLVYNAISAGVTGSVSGQQIAVQLDIPSMIRSNDPQVILDKLGTNDMIFIFSSDETKAEEDSLSKEDLDVLLNHDIIMEDLFVEIRAPSGPYHNGIMRQLTAYSKNRLLAQKLLKSRQAAKKKQQQIDRSSQLRSQVHLLKPTHKLFQADLLYKYALFLKQLQYRYEVQFPNGARVRMPIGNNIFKSSEIILERFKVSKSLLPQKDKICPLMAASVITYRYAPGEEHPMDRFRKHNGLLIRLLKKKYQEKDRQKIVLKAKSVIWKWADSLVK